MPPGKYGFVPGYEHENSHWVSRSQYYFSLPGEVAGALSGPRKGDTRGVSEPGVGRSHHLVRENRAARQAPNGSKRWVC